MLCPFTSANTLPNQWLDNPVTGKGNPRTCPEHRLITVGGCGFDYVTNRCFHPVRSTAFWL